MTRGAAGVALILLALAPAHAAPAELASQLDAVRQECIAAARDAQRHEREVIALDHDGTLLRREADGRQRDLDDSRVEQARLIGMIERLAHHPPDDASPRLLFAEKPLDRLRGELLIKTAVPALRAEAHALVAEIERVAALRGEIAAKQAALASARETVGQDRERLAVLVARRLDLSRHLVPDLPGGEAQVAKLGREAGDISDLIKRADAAAEHRDKELLARARSALPKAKAEGLKLDNADPTRLRELKSFDPPRATLTMPVAGTVSEAFGAATGGDAKGRGMRFTALPGGEVVAPFDGRVVYAGPFGDLGLVLITRHGDLYHTVLGGLGRIDAGIGQWVLAGEPMGAMPDAANAALGALYVELRRGGRPVDPQTHMALRDERRDGQDRNEKVRE